LTSRQEVIAGRPADLLYAAKQVAAGRGWTVAKETATELEFRTRLSVRSWGETVKVTAMDNPSAPGTSLVTVGSSARLQAYDWGKSGGNVGIMMTGLTQGPVSVASRVPGPISSPVMNKKFCANCGKSMPVKAIFCPGCGEKAD